MYGFRFTVYRLDFARCAKPPVFLHFRTGNTNAGCLLFILCRQIESRRIGSKLA